MHGVYKFNIKPKRVARLPQTVSAMLMALTISPNVDSIRSLDT